MVVTENEVRNTLSIMAVGLGGKFSTSLKFVRTPCKGSKQSLVKVFQTMHVTKSVVAINEYVFLSKRNETFFYKSNQ